MACYHPLQAYRCVDGSIVFNQLRKHDILSELKLPCGQCVGCRLERSRQWAIRCMHESQLHEQNCFITLTYHDDFLPYNSSLNYSHFQKFMKRLRFHFSDKKIRFYMCGEYGEQFSRPHFHACLFGIDFEDKKLLTKSPSGSLLFRSDTLESLWSYGFSSIGTVTFETAAYVARYVMKKVTGFNALSHYEGFDQTTGEVIQRTPEFNKMSLKPGIGSGWFDLFKNDVYPHDFVVLNGKEVRPPKYYDRLYKADQPYEFDELLYKRYQDALPFSSDQTPERLAVKEKVAKARVSKLKRSLT